MCLILHKESEVPLDSRIMKHVLEGNGDGFGVMRLAGEDNRILVEKISKPKNWEQLSRRINKLDNNGFPLGIHFRKATKGAAKYADNTHPLRILNRKKHGRDLYVMHNGTVSNNLIECPDNKSDTWGLAQFLRPMLEEAPDLIHHPNFQGMIASTVGHSNKLMFLDGATGNWVFINHFVKGDNLGLNGCKLSNTYTLPPKEEPKQKYTNGYSNLDYSYSTYSYPANREPRWRLPRIEYKPPKFANEKKYSPLLEPPVKMIAPPKERSYTYASQHNLTPTWEDIEKFSLSNFYYLCMFKPELAASLFEELIHATDPNYTDDDEKASYSWTPKR